MKERKERLRKVKNEGRKITKKYKILNWHIKRGENKLENKKCLSRTVFTIESQFKCLENMSLLDTGIDLI
jgi:hypothetical protein